MLRSSLTLKDAMKRILLLQVGLSLKDTEEKRNIYFAILNWAEGKGGKWMKKPLTVKLMATIEKNAQDTTQNSCLVLHTFNLKCASE